MMKRRDDHEGVQRAETQKHSRSIEGVLTTFPSLNLHAAYPLGDFVAGFSFSLIFPSSISAWMDWVGQRNEWLDPGSTDMDIGEKVSTHGSMPFAGLVWVLEERFFFSPGVKVI